MHGASKNDQEAIRRRMGAFLRQYPATELGRSRCLLNGEGDERL